MSAGRKMHPKTIQRHVKRAAQRAGLEGWIHPHRFRHSCATHLLDHGADVRVVQEVMGHASITSTQLYTFVARPRLRRVFQDSHPRA